MTVWCVINHMRYGVAGIYYTIAVKAHGMSACIMGGIVVDPVTGRKRAIFNQGFFQRVLLKRNVPVISDFHILSWRYLAASTIVSFHAVIYERISIFFTHSMVFDVIQWCLQRHACPWVSITVTDCRLLFGKVYID